LNYSGKIESKFPADAGLVGNKAITIAAELREKISMTLCRIFICLVN
jgi:hypothetical protein